MSAGSHRPHPPGPRRGRDRFDGRLVRSDPLGEEHVRRLPARRGVVALLDDGGRCILLMTAANIRARLRSRLRERPDPRATKTADLREVTRQVLWKVTSSHFETDLWFLELAEQMYPRRYASLLAWGRPWWVHVDPQADVPHFARTRSVFEAGRTCLGPFAAARQADAFIDIIQDAFDLCRDVRCLRQAPHGQPCAYAQMGRCPSPCDGTTAMADYRAMVARAAEFAAGRGEGVREELTRRMEAAAGELAFERAAVLKRRLDRLAELDGAAWAHVAPLEAFRFVMIQRGASRTQAHAFFVAGGRIARAGVIDYPLKPRQLKGALQRMRRHLARRARRDEAEQWRLALVAHYLLTSEARRGLILRWREGLTPEELGGAIEAAAKSLRLKRPRRRRKDEPPAEQGTKSDPSGDGPA